MSLVLPARVVLEVVGAVVTLLVGALTSVATVLVHHAWWGLGWGLMAGVLAVLALPPVWWGRFAFVAGWIACSLLVLRGRPEGDYLVAATVAGYLYLGSGLMLVVVAALGPGRNRRPRRNG